MGLLAALFVVFLLLFVSELWWRHQRAHSELSRKFVHITVGSFVAFWPYFLSKSEIVALSVAFVVAVGISKHYRVLKAIHSVQRPTWGEFWFGVVVGLLVVVLNHPHIYTAALLVMSLADGLAAIIGTRYGNGHRYSVFGASKSIVGTLTFFVISCLILAGYSLWTPGVAIGLAILPISLGATVLENAAPKGLDNLLVPLFVACSLAVML